MELRIWKGETVVAEVPVEGDETVVVALDGAGTGGTDRDLAGFSVEGARARVHVWDTQGVARQVFSWPSPDGADPGRPTDG